MCDKMSGNYRSGIRVLDDLIGEVEPGTVIILSGPPKVGKSSLAVEFMYRALQRGAPCFFVAAEYGFRDLQRRAMNFNWFIQPMAESLYVLDLPTKLAGRKLEDSGNVSYSALQNTTDLIVKVGIATRALFQNSSQFVSVFDSVSLLFAFNPERLVLRVLRAYIERIREAGAIAMVTHTTGVVDGEIEEKLLDLFDIRLNMDGNTISLEEDESISDSPYRITAQGIISEH